ncbi:MAG TPA: glutamate decarboxylase [Firmicutes bacterium]|nr:glutamate decarboxylase [Bacillota bacterium]HBK68132.1 glutamate decarboxylase [Bacillota bacterium]HBT17425.1 glutamate decarboxylase [Bacillota bacterium]
MWTVLYIAPNQTTAKRIKDFMEAEGILVRLRPIGLHAEGSYTNFEILVTEAEIEEAQEVLNQALQVRQYREIREK